MLLCFAPLSLRLPGHSTFPYMFSTATPKWLLAAGLAGLVAVPATAQSGSRADISQNALSAEMTPSQTPSPKFLRGGGLIEDPSFELGNTGGVWLTNTPSYLGGSPVFGTPRNSTIPDFARTGVWYALLGTGGPAVSDVYQDVEVDEAGEQTLGFYLNSGSNAGSQSEFRIFIDDEEIDLITADEGPSEYTLYEYAYTFEAAGTYRLRFEQMQVAGAPFTNWFVDDVSLGEPAPPPPVGGDLITLETDDASLGVYSDARIGTNGGPNYTGPGFVFGDAQADGTALFSSVFVAGVSGTQLSGTSYDADSDWIAESDFEPIDVPAGFDSAFESIITDANAENPLGLRVAQRAYSLSSDDDVSAGFVLEYVIENASEDMIDDLYAGIFADWDVGDFVQNLAGFYDGAGVGLNYVFENGGATNSAYYGVAALNQEVSGYAFDQEAGNDSPEGEVEIFEGLSQTNVAPATPGDRRTTTGVGPYDLASGEFVGVRFALVGGTDAADIQANAEALAAAVADLAFAPVPAPPPIDAAFDNGVISFEALGNGYFGAGQDVGGSGFSFDGANGLFEGQFLVGLSAANVVGAPYNPGEYEVVEALRFADVPPGFQNSTQAVFASADGAVEVTERVFVPSNFPFVVLRYTVQNTSGGPLTGVYVGPFADFDIGSAVDNVGGYDAANRLVYASDAAVGDDTDFFGITSRTVNSGVSGWSVSTGTSDAGLYTALSTPGMMDEAPDDRRLVLGNGPYSLVDGQSITVEYALVAGETLANLQAAAIQAQTAPLPTASEEPAEELALAKTNLRVFPNPVASSATVAFRAPAGADARVVVYDVLGREVLRVADQMATDLEQQVSFSTAVLPAGLYLVRLTAAGTSAVQQITVVR